MHEGSALRIEADAVVEASVLLGADVEVTERRPPDGAPVQGFVSQLDLDVFAALADLQLVEDIDDGLHGVSHRAAAEVLLARHDAYAEQAERALGECSIGGVPEDA
jgi:hypothetical protein